MNHKINPGARKVKLSNGQFQALDYKEEDQNSFKVQLIVRVHHFLGFFDELFAPKVQVNLLLSDSDKSNDWLAMYDVKKSTISSIYIHFNFKLFLDIRARKSEFFDELLDRSIVHELTHALDQTVIKESIRVYHERPSSNDWSKWIKPGGFWRLMYYFHLIRNEGIASFTEDLLIGKSKQSDPQENVQRFAADLCIMESLLDKSDWSNIHSNKFYSLSKSAHLHGKALLEQIHPSPLSQQSFSELLREIICVDLSEWILYMLKYKPYLIKSHLFNLFEKVSRKNSAISIQDLISLEGLNDGQFVLVLSSVCEKKMNEEELSRYLSLISLNNQVDDISSYLFRKTKLLMDKKNEQNALLVDWTLSYVFQKVDLFHDQLAFVGELDDCFVVNAALKKIV
jgi:hypothetical protein